MRRRWSRAATSRTAPTSTSASASPRWSPTTSPPAPAWCCTPRTACSTWARPPTGDEVDPDLTNAGKIPVTELPGASYFHHADSFAMMRGGHLDVCVLGAFQVSAAGDLANWHTGEPDAIPAVGGAMDLAIGAKQVFVMMTLFAKDGSPKLVPSCTYPLTGVGCVDRVYTDLATFEVGPRRRGRARDVRRHVRRARRAARRTADAGRVLARDRCQGPAVAVRAQPP